MCSRCRRTAMTPLWRAGERARDSAHVSRGDPCVFLLMGTWPVGVPAPRGGRTHGGREGDRLPEDRGVARGGLKHARATHAHVAVVYALPQVTLSVADDGHGFDPDASRGAEHRGLRNLRRRAEEVR